MGTFDVSHPDVKDFIRAKREDGRLRQFNLSLLITDGFMDAVNRDKDWPLVFPLARRKSATSTCPTPSRWSGANGRRPGATSPATTAWSRARSTATGRARHLWDMIMVSTYDFAEPGFILIDRVNEMNNNWWCENIRATNPAANSRCRPTAPACWVQVNLTKFVASLHRTRPRSTGRNTKEVVRVFTRMLDNVVEVNGLPLQQQRDEILRKRRHGMGFSAWAAP